MNLVQRQDCLVGFRPEHFLPQGMQASRDHGASFPFRVTRLEDLGADRLLYGVLEAPFSEEKVIARLPSTVTVSIRQGERYEFAVPVEELRFFDRATGLRTVPRPM